jgi:16S rRNA (adenine1518-N6/adenine1519-N6)-dimethyltransferase
LTGSDRQPVSKPATRTGADRPPLREIIARHGLTAKRSLGQHFLLDGNLCARIARAAGDLTTHDVIEIGPGPGGLTRALLDAGARRIVAIERDERCVAALGELPETETERLQIIHGDALETDIVGLTTAPRLIVANLPYNVSVPLLLRWLGEVDAYSGMTLMFQKEVAARLTASPGSKEFGRLSVICQWLCDARTEFNVSKAAFTPPPKVTSTVVSLTPHAEPLTARFDVLEKVTAAAFGQRRKMVRTSLKGLGLDLAAAGVEETARAEELSVEQFCALARAVAENSP